MYGWTGFWTHERAEELRMEAERRRFIRELRAARTKGRGDRVPRLLRGLSEGVAGLAARRPGRARDVPAR